MVIKLFIWVPSGKYFRLDPFPGAPRADPVCYITLLSFLHTFVSKTSDVVSERSNVDMFSWIKI